MQPSCCALFSPITLQRRASVCEHLRGNDRSWERQPRISLFDAAVEQQQSSIVKQSASRNTIIQLAVHRLLQWLSPGHVRGEAQLLVHHDYTDARSLFIYSTWPIDCENLKISTCELDACTSEN